MRDKQEKMDIVTTRASNIHFKGVAAKEVSFLMNEPYEAYQAPILPPRTAPPPDPAGYLS